jgi:8-oxo-dGTP pyrophosphatase MutT (NUDIX family)
LIENNKILLSKQWDGYDFPGGGINIHETIEGALKREFFEETGLKVEPLFPVHCETSFYIPRKRKKIKKQYWNCILMFVLVKKVGGKISIDNLDEPEKEYVELPEWIKISDLKNTKFYNSVDSVAIINKVRRLLKRK